MCQYMFCNNSSRKDLDYALNLIKAAVKCLGIII